jgi:esterase/lipase superfamily enzyme
MFRVKHGLAAASVGLALALTACAGRPLQGVLAPVAQSAEGTSRIHVLVATTRQRSGEAGEMFSSGRAADMSYSKNDMASDLIRSFS